VLGAAAKVQEGTSEGVDPLSNLFCSSADGFRAPSLLRKRRYCAPRYVWLRSKVKGSQAQCRGREVNHVASPWCKHFVATKVCNFISHWLSCTSLFRHGRFLACRAFTR
jgi:hypothetical protein